MEDIKNDKDSNSMKAGGGENKYSSPPSAIVGLDEIVWMAIENDVVRLINDTIDS